MERYIRVYFVININQLVSHFEASSLSEPASLLDLRWRVPCYYDRPKCLDTVFSLIALQKFHIVLYRVTA